MNNYDIAVPVFIKGFNNLLKWLAKAEAFAGSDEAMNVMLASGLAPDMFSLKGQIQIASDMAKGCGARLGGIEAPRFDDNEQNLTDLRIRIAKTVIFLEGLLPEKFIDSAATDVNIKTMYGALDFTSRDYLLQFSLPNFFFHITTAYNIMRHNGVPLGKMDYLGVFADRG